MYAWIVQTAAPKIITCAGMIVGTVSAKNAPRIYYKML